MFKFVDNWKDLLKRAYTVWLAYFLAFISAVEIALPYVLDGLRLPGFWSAWISLISALLIVYARIKAQPKLHEPKEDESSPWDAEPWA